MSRPGYRVVAVGDLTADLIVEGVDFPIQADAFQTAEAVHLEPGGSANLLILLSRLGITASALGSLGDDLWGDQVCRILESENVELAGISRGGTTTVALVLVDGEGRHSFLGSYGQSAALVPGDQEGATVSGADALFTSGYSLSEARLRDLTLEAMKVAGTTGIPRFFDPGPAFKDLKGEVGQRALANCDVLLLTEDELFDLSPEGAETLLGSDGDAKPASRYAPQQIRGPHTVVVKKGSAGCRLHHNRGVVLDIPGVSVPVRDTTAAGDCFAAGYILAYLKGWSSADCARLGNCAGAASVQKIGGGRNVPTFEEVKNMISRTGWDIRV